LFASLVLLMAVAKKKPRKTGATSGHITNLKQSISETFDIYGQDKLGEGQWHVYCLVLYEYLTVSNFMGRLLALTAHIKLVCRDKCTSLQRQRKMFW
jgi:hypothetical protein